MAVKENVQPDAPEAQGNANQHAESVGETVPKCSPERPIEEKFEQANGTRLPPLQDSASNRKRKSMPKKELRDASPTIREHESFCRICARGGPFMKCSTCTAVYHKTCMHEVAWKLTRKGTWRCYNCLHMRGKDALRPDNLRRGEPCRKRKLKD